MSHSNTWNFRKRRKTSKKVDQKQKKTQRDKYHFLTLKKAI